MWRKCIALTILLLSYPALAINTNMQMNGASFTDACTRIDESWVNFCNGYIQAVVDSIKVNDEVCLPNGTTRSALITISEREISNSTTLRAMNARDAVLSVLRSRYPC